MLLTVALLISACASPVAEEPATGEPVAEEPAAGAPTELKGRSGHRVHVRRCPGVFVVECMVEKLLIGQPYGLPITVDVTEGVWGADAELALREYAETGNHDIIWAHSSYSDQVKNLYQDYPEILWDVSGSGN